MPVSDSYEPLERISWKMGEPGADHTVRVNCRVLDLILGTLKKKCCAPGCEWGISALRTHNYEVPEVGEVCATCWDVYNSLTMANRYLQNTMYFRNHHTQWKLEQEAIRKRAGLK